MYLENQLLLNFHQLDTPKTQQSSLPLKKNGTFLGVLQVTVKIYHEIPHGSVRIPGHFDG